MQCATSLTPSVLFSDVPDIDRLRDFFDTRAVRGNAFLVAQGNIYVTQQWIRYLILQCRTSLLEKSGMAYRFADDPRHQNETLHAISNDLLMILRSIPIECVRVAAASPSSW
jgi:hypothetical protein